MAARRRPKNQRGELYCSICEKWLPPSEFRVLANRPYKDGSPRHFSWCRRCQNAYANDMVKRRYRLDPKARESTKRRSGAWTKRKRETKWRERRELVPTMINGLRDRGFTLRDIEALSGLGRGTLTYLARGKRQCIPDRSYRQIERIYLQFLDWPTIGRPRNNQPSKHRSRMPALIRATDHLRKEPA